MFKYIVLILSILFLGGCAPDKEKINVPSNNSKNYSSETLKENISYKDYMTEQKKVILVITNNNEVSVSSEIIIKFYDDKGDVINEEKNHLDYIAPGKEAAIEVYNTPKKYDKYEVLIETEYYSKENYMKNIKITTEEEENTVIVKALNNSDSDFEELSLAIIFYDNNKVVAYDVGLKFNVLKNKEVSFTFNEPLDTNYEKIKYDDYKIFINKAY